MFRATEGSTESLPLVFGVETVLWTTTAKKRGKWYRGVVEAAERSFHDEVAHGRGGEQLATPRKIKTRRVMTKEGGEGRERQPC